MTGKSYFVAIFPEINNICKSAVYYFFEKLLMCTNFAADV